MPQTCWSAEPENIYFYIITNRHIVYQLWVMWHMYMNEFDF